MSAKISVIIPRHNETEEFMRPLLSSIDNQIGIEWGTEKGSGDIEVIIVNDIANNELKPEEFDNYLHIKPIQLYNKKEKNMGISRQIGIDNAHGDFLLFADADDMYHNCGLFTEFLNRAYDPNNQFDVLVTTFIEEYKHEQEGNARAVYQYVPHPQDFTWMFAKMYRKEFILKNNIRFHADLLVHEDTYFNAIFRAYNPRILFLDTFSYVWRFNPNSITRNNNGAYSYNSICTFIDSVDFAIDVIDARNLTNIIDHVIQLPTYIFHTISSEVWLQENFAEYKPKVERRLAEFCTKHKEILEKVEPQRLYQHLQQEYVKAVQKAGLCMLRETWNDFMDRIISEYNKDEAKADADARKKSK